MSRSHDGQWPFFPFGNPIRMILPKGSYIPSKLKNLLNAFEETLAERFRKLKPKDETEVVSLSWMRRAMESLSETHNDVKTLITDLQFPVSDWDSRWMDMYLDNSVKLLDVCIAFSSEISRLDQGQLLLQYALHVIDTSSDFPSEERLKKADISLIDWMQRFKARSPKIENSCFNLEGLARSLCFPKSKSSSKGKILMQAMYGVKVQTIFVCSIFSAAFTSSLRPLMDLQVPEKFPWAKLFNDLQGYVNGEIRRRISSGRPIILRELEAVSCCSEKLHDLISGATRFEANSFQKENVIDHQEDKSSQIVNETKVEVERLQGLVTELGEAAGKAADGLEFLSKEVAGFFQIVLSGRDALLCNLRVSDVMQENNPDENSFLRRLPQQLEGLRGIQGLYCRVDRYGIGSDDGYFDGKLPQLM